jgi:hypothetical protein
MGTGGVDGYDGGVGAEGAGGGGVVMLFGLLPHPTSERPKIIKRQKEIRTLQERGTTPDIHGLQISMVYEANPGIWKRRTAGLLALASRIMKTMKVPWPQRQ